MFMGYHIGARCTISLYIFITSAVLRAVTATSASYAAASNWTVQTGRRGVLLKQSSPTVTFIHVNRLELYESVIYNSIGVN